MTFESILVVAAGAVGGYYGARPWRAGKRVTFVARGAHAEALRARAGSPWRTWTIPSSFRRAIRA